MNQTTPLSFTALAKVDIPATLHVRAFQLNASDSLNQKLLRACEDFYGDDSIRRTHLFHGRYENLYPPRERIPVVEPLISQVSEKANELLSTNGTLRVGFWFNRMAPGHVTTLHRHDDDDELLSAVYYVQVPEKSGDILFHSGSTVLRHTPCAGQLLFFPPTLPHEVQKHRGKGIRLSVAFNFGPNTVE